MRSVIFKRRLVLVTVAALAVLAVAGPAAANVRHYTEGDAQVMLRTYPAAGDIHFPPSGARGLDIRPSQEFYGDVTYCAPDWHVLALEWDDAEFSEPGGTVWTHLDVMDFLGGVEMEFFLDGTPVEATRMPIQPNMTAYARAQYEALYGPTVTVGRIWGFQVGRVLAPSDLSVDEHTLRVRVTHANDGVLFDQSLVFTVRSGAAPECN